MDSQRINDLLERYYQGETTLAEETELNTFFAHGNVPEHLQGEQAQFAYYQLARAEQSSAPDWQPPVQRKGRVIRMGAMQRSLFAMAAGVALLIGVFVFQSPEPTPVLQSEKTTAGEVTNPQLAYSQAKEALLLISTKLNRGKRDVSRLKIFSQAQQKVRGDRRTKIKTKNPQNQ